MSAGDHWRVRIFPTHHEGKRVESLRDAKEIVDKSQVRLRGWYYPHIDREGIVPGDGWVESSGDFRGHLEYWRFYLSGQYLHLMAYPEDEEDTTAQRLPPGVRGLEVVTTVYRFTEIFTFASRLATKGILDPGATVSVTLSGTEGRQLFFYEAGRYLSLDYRCRVPSLTVERSVAASDLMARADEIAIDASVHVLERFGWLDVGRGVLLEDQKRFLERRF